MVRKRNRRHYESDDNDDSGSDYARDSPIPEEPAPKKYSLRQRKRTIFTEDFEYDLDEEDDELPRFQSEDEDFVVENDPPIQIPPSIPIEPTDESEFIDNSTYIKKIEPEVENVTEEDELIDFEDMIRADIVVNKNRIDYDNLIEKTEIKVQPNLKYVNKIEKEYTQAKAKVPGRRGRKPKVTPVVVENGHSIFQDLLEPIIESTINNDTNSSDDLPLAVAMRRKSEVEHKSEDDLIIQQENGATQVQEQIPEDIVPEVTLTEETKIENGVNTLETLQIPENCGVNKIEEEMQENNISSEVSQVDLDGNISEVQPTINENISNNIKLPVIQSIELQHAEENDDVIIIEDERNVIVLDD